MQEVLPEKLEFEDQSQTGMLGTCVRGCIGEGWKLLDKQMHAVLFQFDEKKSCLSIY
jgi:hypothetical protein